MHLLYLPNHNKVLGSQDSANGIAPRYRLDGLWIDTQWWGDFLCHPEQTQGLSSLLYNGNLVFARSNESTVWR
jgi:hypothetical protein